MRLSPLAFALVLASCDSPSTTPDAAPPPAAASVVAPPVVEGPAPPPAEDLDVPTLQKLLKCGGSAGACGVLEKFAHCGPWSAQPPSGDGRWLGRSFLVEGAKTTEGFLMVRAHRVPLSDVGPGQVGVKIGIDDLLKDDGAAFDQAERAIRALERQDVPPHGNATLELIKARTSWHEVHALKTANGQINALTPNGAFICQGAKQQLVLVQRNGARSSGDGLYAELWATSW